MPVAVVVDVVPVPIATVPLRCRSTTSACITLHASVPCVGSSVGSLSVPDYCGGACGSCGGGAYAECHSAASYAAAPHLCVPRSMHRFHVSVLLSVPLSAPDVGCWRQCWRPGIDIGCWRQCWRPGPEKSMCYSLPASSTALAEVNTIRLFAWRGESVCGRVKL